MAAAPAAPAGGCWGPVVPVAGLLRDGAGTGGLLTWGLANHGQPQRGASQVSADLSTPAVNSGLANIGTNIAGLLRDGAGTGGLLTWGLANHGQPQRGASQVSAGCCLGTGDPGPGCLRARHPIGGRGFTVARFHGNGYRPRYGEFLRASLPPFWQSCCLGTGDPGPGCLRARHPIGGRGFTVARFHGNGRHPVTGSPNRRTADPPEPTSRVTAAPPAPRRYRRTRRSPGSGVANQHTGVAAGRHPVTGSPNRRTADPPEPTSRVTAAPPAPRRYLWARRHSPHSGRRLQSRQTFSYAAAAGHRARRRWLRERGWDVSTATLPERAGLGMGPQAFPSQWAKTPIPPNLFVCRGSGPPSSTEISLGKNVSAHSAGYRGHRYWRNVGPRRPSAMYGLVPPAEVVANKSPCWPELTAKPTSLGKNVSAHSAGYRGHRYWRNVGPRRPSAMYGLCQRFVRRPLIPPCTGVASRVFKQHGIAVGFFGRCRNVATHLAGLHR